MPAGTVIVMGVAPGAVTEDGLKVAQLDDAPNVTVPVKPSRTLIATVEVTTPPDVTVKAEGLAEIVKSGDSRLGSAMS